MKRTEKSEYTKGKESGIICSKTPLNPLHQENYDKALKCCKEPSEEPLILAYWKGFIDGWINE